MRSSDKQPVDASVQAVDGKNKNQVSRFPDQGEAGVTGGGKFQDGDYMVLMNQHYNITNEICRRSLGVLPKTRAVMRINRNGESPDLELHLDQTCEFSSVLAWVGQVHVPAGLGVEAVKQFLEKFEEKKTEKQFQIKTLVDACRRQRAETRSK